MISTIVRSIRHHLEICLYKKNVILNQTALRIMFNIYNGRTQILHNKQHCSQNYGFNNLNII